MSDSNTILKTVGVAAPPKRVAELDIFVDVSTSTSMAISPNSNTTRREGLERATLTIVRRAQAMFMELLPPNVEVDIHWFSFASSVAPMPCVHGEPALPPVHGGTNFSQVLYQINDIHKQRPGRRKTAIIISDGEPSEGETDPTRLAHDAGELRADTRVTLVGVHVGFDEGYDILARLVGDEELTFRVGDESEMLTKLAGIVRAVVESTVTNVAPAIAIKQALVPGEASAS